MKQVKIPKDMLMIGSPIAINVLKFSTERGLENGLIPQGTIEILVNGNVTTYQQCLYMMVTENTVIELRQ